MTDIDRESRRRTLYAALGFCQLEDPPSMPEVTALKRWLSTWSGIGHVVVGMERQGYAVALRKIHDDGWAATFHEHPMLSPARLRDGTDALRGGVAGCVAGTEPPTDAETRPDGANRCSVAPYAARSPPAQ